MSCPKHVENRRACRQTSSDTCQAQIDVFELALPNIYNINELLEGIKGLVLQIQNYRIPMTQDSKRVSQRSPGEVPLLIV